MSDPYLGEIRPFPYKFAPAGWAECNGQLLQIAEHDALFSLIGATFGGDGQNTFALPDLRGRNPLHEGQGPGLSSYVLGQKGGKEKHTLTADELPSHDHDVRGSKKAADTANPTQAAPAAGGDYDSRPVADADQVTMGPTYPRGQNAAHNTVQPYLSARYCISLFGIYPTS